MFTDNFEEELLLKSLACQPARKSGPGRSWGTMNKTTCGVLHCSSCTLTCPNLWFFKLPSKLTIRREEWLRLIGRPTIQPYQSLLVCEKHFAPSDIHGKSGTTKRYLKYSANPTLLLPNVYRTTVKTNLKRVHPKNISQMKVYKKTKPTTKPDERQNIAIKVEKNEDSAENRDENEELYHLSSLARTSGNKTIESFVKLYIDLKDQNESEKTYSNEYKIKILQLYNKYSMLYTSLQSMLGLPPVSILPSFIRTTQVARTEIYINSLKNKIGNMSLEHKYGLICLSVIKIQPYVTYDYKLDYVSGICNSNVAPTQYAVLAMVRGVVDNWHHFASIFFMENLTTYKEFNTWLDNLITALNEIGINVKGVITSTDDFFIDSLRVLKLMAKKNIFWIFDPHHLMLVLYEELHKHTFSYVRSQKRKKIFAKIKWEHIEMFYMYDSSRKLRLTKRSCNIDPDDLQQNKLNAAADILSLNTATGMSFLVDLKILDEKATDTIDFIVRMNSIFAALYTPTHKPEDKNANQEDYSFWDSSMKFLDSIKCVDNSNKVISNLKFVNCFNKSIKSITVMQKASSMSPYASVLTHHLNNNPLTELIHNINLKRLKHKHPTVNELLDIINENFMQNKLHNMKIEVNSMENFIEDVNSVIEESCYNVEIPLQRSPLEDYTQMDHDDASTVLYVATYLLDKMYKKHKNVVCSRMVFMASSVHYENREAGISGSIIIPDNDFLQYLRSLELVFVDHCKKAIASGRIYDELMKQVNKLSIKNPFDREPMEYIKSLFIDLRLYHTIKYNNDRYEECGESEEFVVKRLSE